MTRFYNRVGCLLSFAGVVWSCVLTYQGTRPCGSDGCMIHLLLIPAAIVFLIAGPVFYVTLKREIKYFDERSTK